VAVASAMDNIQQTANEQRERESALRRIAGMSARERQVFDGLLADGTNKAIGKQLGISPRTVEMHRASVMERLGARTLPESRADGGGGGHPPAARARSNAFR
jgi:FixJ family two-component response regulator